MTDSAPEAEKIAPPPLGPSWARILSLLSVMGVAFAWLVSNWNNVQPVMQSPPMVLVALLSTYGLGGLSAYWLVARPLEKRLNSAEGVINRLRADERVLRDEMSALRVTVAELRTAFDILEKRTPAASPRRKPSPKGDPQ